MWRTALPLLAASLAVALARPHLKPLSSDMVNYINKINTTWKVICVHIQHIQHRRTIRWPLALVDIIISLHPAGWTQLP